MADRLEIVDAIESLAVHCRPPLMSVEDRSRWMMDWCSDLAPFPIENIRMATTRWRQGENHKFPTPGQLIPMVRATVRTESDAGAYEPWRPLSDDEYRSLTVREKIRHHRIMADYVMDRAGPMFRNMGLNQRGHHIDAADMPPRWHAARREREHHLEQINRLREVIVQPRIGAAG